MQEKVIEAIVEQSGTFTDLIRSNFRQIYDAYFSTQINIKEDDASKELGYKSSQSIC